MTQYLVTWSAGRYEGIRSVKAGDRESAFEKVRDWVKHKYDVDVDSWHIEGDEEDEYDIKDWNAF